jgi:hypothetical protein
MKTKFFLLTGILGIALAGAVFTGCKKDSTAATPDTDYTAAEDESNASNASTDTKNVSDAAAQGQQNEYLKRPGRSLDVLVGHCTVTWSLPADTTSGVDTMYINFGPAPVQCNDLRWRQGEVIVYWTRHGNSSLLQTYFDSGSAINMTFKNYASGATASNMVGISGLRTWTNLGVNALLEQNWSFSANLTLSYNTGQTATWTSNRTNTLVEVSGTYYYEVTGTAEGVSRKGIGYTLTITSPLYVTALPWWLGGCAWIESGTISINVTSSTNTMTINFGTIGACNDYAIVTLAGVNYTYYYL